MKIDIQFTNSSLSEVIEFSDISRENRHHQEDEIVDGCFSFMDLIGRAIVDFACHFLHC